MNTWQAATAWTVAQRRKAITFKTRDEEIATAQPARR